MEGTERTSNNITEHNLT